VTIGEAVRGFARVELFNKSVEENLNRQGAEERQEREQCSAGLHGHMRTPAEHFDVS
jgi:hypothetical protein